MLIKRVYEIDPLACPNRGGVMKVALQIFLDARRVRRRFAPSMAPTRDSPPFFTNLSWLHSASWSGIKFPITYHFKGGRRCPTQTNV